MDEFVLEGHGDFLKITFEEVFGYPNNTSPWGGYDTKSVLALEVDDFKVNSTFYVSTGELSSFTIYF
jgi:hypothetical protein